MPVHGAFGEGMPPAQDHLDWLPRIIAIVANSLGTLAVVVVALSTMRRRPLGNALISRGRRRSARQRRSPAVGGSGGDGRLRGRRRCSCSTPAFVTPRAGARRTSGSAAG